jgi:DNA processing protein
MKYTENAVNILTVRTFERKGAEWINEHLKGNESITSICCLLNTTEEDFIKNATSLRVLYQN